MKKKKEWRREDSGETVYVEEDDKDGVEGKMMKREKLQRNGTRMMEDEQMGEAGGRVDRR